MTQAVARGELSVEAPVEEVVKSAIVRYNHDRSKLIAILQVIQSEFQYLPREALKLVSDELGFSLSEVLNVATFYHQFRLEPVGKYVIYVCFGTACYLKGSSDIYNALRSSLGIKEGMTTASDRSVTVEKARCFGCCSLAPVVMVISSDGLEKYVHGKLTPVDARKIAMTYRSKALSRTEGVVSVKPVTR